MKATADNLGAVRARLAELEKAETKRKEIATLPPEVFLRARKLRKKRKFKRGIVKREPLDLDWDAVQLECGHKTKIFEQSNSEPRECSECLEAWLQRQRKKAKATK